MDDGQLIFAAGALLAVGLGASLLAGRLRIPGLVLFLGVGMAVGSDGLGIIDFGRSFEDIELARSIGIIALALILFEGGLAAGLPEIRPVLKSAVSLAILGTLVTALVTGFAAAWLLGLSTLEGLLVGAILSATDGAAIFALLRTSTLRRRLARTLEGEAGTNDPIAVLLVLGFIEWIQRPDYGIVDMLGLFVTELGIGAVVGTAVGLLAVRAFRGAKLATPGLYPVASLAVVALAFGAADLLHGSGFLAVYLAGLALGSTRSLPARQTITVFHDGIAWVAQLAMFLTLGLLVFPSELPDIALEGTLVAVVLVFVARPVAVVIATAFSRLTARERVVLGWAGLRGAVPVVLATFPLIEGVPGSVDFFNIVFFAVLLSTLLQGATFEPLARRLKATTNEPALPRPLVEVGTIRRLGADVVEVPIRAGDAAVGARVRDLGLPREALVNVLVRGDEALPPRGSTRLEAGDRLHIVVRQASAQLVREASERWRTGPVGPAPRPPRVPATRAPIFTMRPWQSGDGDPQDPRTVLGLEVVERLRTRWDRPGALVALEDGRYAVTGPHILVGSRDQLQWHARRLLRRAEDDGERVWWQDVIGAAAL